jgi:hypothetical protein
LEAKLGLAAMMESAVHAYDSRSLLFLFHPVSKRLLNSPLCSVQWHQGAVLINQLLEAS